MCNRQQMSGQQFPASESGKACILKQRFPLASARQSSGSSFLLSLSGAGGKSVTQDSITAIRAKEKALLVLCSATLNRKGKTSQNINRAED